MPYTNKEDAAEWHKMHDAERKRAYRAKKKAAAQLVPTAILKVAITPHETPSPQKKDAYVSTLEPIDRHSDRLAQEPRKLKHRSRKTAPAGSFFWESIHADDIEGVISETLNRWPMEPPKDAKGFNPDAEFEFLRGNPIRYACARDQGYLYQGVYPCCSLKRFKPEPWPLYNAPLPQPTIERDWSKHPCRKLRHGVLRPIGVYPWDTLNKNCWSWISILADHYPEKLPRDPLAVKIGETETSSGSAWQRVNGYPAGFFPQRKSWPWGELGFFQRWDDAVRTQVDFLRKKALILPS